MVDKKQVFKETENFDSEEIENPFISKKERSKQSKRTKPSRPIFISIFAILTFLSAVSGLCGLFPTIASISSFGLGSLISTLIILLLVIQVGLYIAVGVGLWTLKPWSWWLITAFQPFSITFGLTISYFIFSEFNKAMIAISNIPEFSSEMQSMQPAYMSGLIIGIFISLFFLVIIELLFWNSRESFFGRNNTPISIMEFGLMNLVALIFGAVLAIIIFIFIQTSGFSIETVITDFMNSQIIY